MGSAASNPEPAVERSQRPTTGRRPRGNKHREGPDLDKDDFDNTNNEVPPFKVVGVDLHVKENRKAHRTNEYDHEELVVRRGQEFTLEVKVDRKFEKGEDVIRFQLSMGKTPMESKGTMFFINPGDAIDTKDASAVIDDVIDDESGSTIKVRMNLPSDSVIGRFALRVRMRNKEDKGKDRKFIKYLVPDSIIVLFNPWCEDDVVYLADDQEKHEYVLNENGRIYRGSSDSIRYKRWVFGQFHKVALDAALYVLDESDLPWAGYGNPVRVTRTLSSKINSADRGVGILVGNWTGKYDDGTSPTAWAGSVNILAEFMETKSDVKYGQCWVFSGVTTTLCRALGIPTRSVTNFDSAHDTDGSMTIDYHIDEDGDMIKNMNDDSIWNFHVWNEAWFKRPDLPDAMYGGWQAFDSTPQEASDGVYRCGPVPLVAIQRGDVHIPYDGKFIYSEVNGDKITWEKSSEGLRVVAVDTDRVGAHLSTKKVGSDDREDVTNLYKYKEGSKTERAVVHKTAQLSTKRNGLDEFYKLDQKHDVDCTFEANIARNGNADFVFKAKNTSDEKRTIQASFNIVATYYTGIEGEKIDSKKAEMTLEAGKEEEFKFNAQGADWLNKVDEDATIGVFARAKVVETKQTFVSQHAYEMDKPDVEVKLSKDKCKAWETVEVEVKLENPLEIPLKRAKFVIEGAGIADTKVIKIPGEIAPGATVTETIKVKPRMVGPREIIAVFHSRQLINIEGHAKITVEEAD